MTRLEQVIATLINKNIIVLGAGLTGISCMRFLKTHGLNFAVIDSRDNTLNPAEFSKDYPQCNLYQGEWHFDLIEKAEVILLSPGINIEAQGIAKHINTNCKVMGDVELFCQINEKPVVAVTGSNGKSTVVSLLAHVGKAIGKNVGLGGNIGVPVLSQLANNVESFILELSSFQLEHISSLKAQGACVLNVSDDHLDRHKTLANYAIIKTKIYNQCQVAVFNRQDNLTRVNNINEATQLVSFGTDEPSEGDFGLKNEHGEFFLMQGTKVLVPLSQLPLAGLHNAVNYLAVLALGQSLSWPVNDMLLHLQSFNGLDHRCQRVNTNDGISWINDSKATNVGASVAAITGLAPTLAGKKLILIAGGEGKGADFSPLKALFAEHVSKIYVLGKDRAKIAQLSEKTEIVNTVQEAVEHAKKIACEGDIVLLSPACASIDMFRNYEERGQTFVNAINANIREAS